LPLYLTGGLLICALSWVEVGVVGAAGAAGATAAAGLLLAVWSSGSLVGGLVGGARPARRGPARRLLVLLVAVAAAHLALAAVSGGLLLLGVLLALAGGLVAPALGGIYTLVQARAPAGAVTQTFAGLTVSLLGGAALGSALAGAVVDAHGPDAAFALGAVPAAVAALVVVVGLVRRPRPVEVAAAT
ncbi:MAG TPA: hypothetical protein VE547_06155, partial [Mycobacteriales bacterium]|nr:hypothetical protein [Mycobacteriales bacterium]